MPDDTEAPNVLRLLAGSAKPNPSDDALRAIRKDIESGALLARYILFGAATRAKFDGLVKAGFTEAQALYLVGVSPF